MPLKKPVKINTQNGGQTQVKHGRPTGSNDQSLQPIDLSQEVPDIAGTVMEIDRVLAGYTKEQRRDCGCGGSS